MDKREKELSELTSYTEEIDKDLTMILQTLQWDRPHLLQGKPLVKCKQDPGHRIPEEIKEKHELECFLKKHGYLNDALLPEPLDCNASTVVKISNTDISNIINIAATSDPSFRKGVGCQGPQPLTLERLQATYSMDERRAIHNAVVSKAPASEELMDLTLPSGGDQGPSKGKKSRLEVLSEMRDMKRRPVKYRVASKTRNYSDVLRGVINNQMEMYTGVKSDQSLKQELTTFRPMIIKQEYSPHREEHEHNSNNYETDRYIPDREIKKEPRYDSTYTRENRTEERRTSKCESEERRNRHNFRGRSEYSNSKHDSDRRPNKERERIRSKSKEMRHKSDDHHRHKDRRRHAEGSDEYYRDKDRKRHKEGSEEYYRHKDRRRHEEESEEYYRHKDRKRHEEGSEEYYRHKDRRRHEEGSSRDKRKEERPDKYRSNGSHSHSEVKVKEEKLTRYYDGYEDYDNGRH